MSLIRYELVKKLLVKKILNACLTDQKCFIKVLKRLQTPRFTHCHFYFLGFEEARKARSLSRTNGNCWAATKGCRNEK
jgi:hypothetical protein